MELKVLKRINGVVVLLMGLVLVVFWQRPDGRLHLTACDVGQGDGILIGINNYQMLVDGGPGDLVLTCLGKQMGFWDRTIEVMVLTHPQADHMTGLIEVVRRYKVERLVTGKVGNNIGEFRKFYELVVEKEIPVYSLVQGEKLKFGPVDFEVMWPVDQTGELTWSKADGDKVLGAKYSGNVNEISVVLKGSFGEFDFLLTGDIDEKIEGELVDRLGEVEVLKVAHHGSRYSTSEEFLTKVKPEVALISVGENNQFGHPTKTVLERLEKQGAKILRTDLEGQVEIISDGVSFWIE